MATKKQRGAARPPSVRTGPGLTLEEHDKLQRAKQTYYVPVTGGMMPTDKRIREVIAQGRYMASMQVIVIVPEDWTDDQRSAMENRVGRLQEEIEEVAAAFTRDGLVVEVI